MKCDLKVSMFKSRRWCDTADYLFFRNNYGDQIKLGEKLIPDNNVTCYSCQCTWLNISDNVISVDKIKNVDWTCNGHHDI